MTASNEQSRWRSVEPDLPAELPDFMLRSLPPAAKPPAAKPPVRRARASGSGTIRVLWIALAIGGVAAAAAGGSYWLMSPGQRPIAEKAAPVLKSPMPSVAPPEAASTPPSHQLAAGLPLPSAPPAEPATPTVMPPPAAATKPADATAPGPQPTTPQAPQAKPALAPQQDVFRVRFDSKLPGLTPTGLRTLDAALRARDAGRKVQFTIEGCDGTDDAPKRTDCAELVRDLKRILVDSGFRQPAALIASPQ